MSNKTHIGSETNKEIDDDENNGSFVVILLVCIEIIRKNRQERHRKPTSTNSRTTREIIEKKSYKKCRPDPEKENPFFSMKSLDHTTNSEEK